MRRYVLIGLYILCMGLMASEGFAQFPTDARLEALGGAGVGLIGSGQAILYNPAGLAFMEGREAYFTSGNWIGGLRYYLAGVSAHVPRIGTFGLSVIGTFGLSVVNHDFGSDVLFEGTTQEISKYAISGAYGVMITNRISVGTTLKLSHESYAREDQINVFAFDLGMYFATGFRNTVIAMGVENLSTSGLGGEPEQWRLPKNVRLGVLLDVVALMDIVPLPHALDLVVDVNNPNDSVDGFYMDIGLEYTYLYHTAIGPVLGFSLRGGAKKRPQSIIDPNTLGIGVQFQAGGLGLKVDYANKSFESFFDERVHILSVAFSF